MKGVHIFLACLSCLFLYAPAYSQVYTSAESVEYDPVNDQWLVSNGQNIIADDGQGNLSFFGSSVASHGMEILSNIVYCSTGNGIIGVDLITEEEVMSVSIPGAFVNGLTNDGGSTLYATGFSSKKIYKIDVSDIKNPVLEVFIDNTIETPNGIIHDAENNRLIYLTWENNAKIKQIDLNDKSISTIATTDLDFLDGIDEDEEGNFYVSSWNPDAITKFSNDFSTSELINTPALSNPADIGYNKDSDVLGIPMGSNVIFVDLGDGSVSAIDLEENQTRFRILNSGTASYFKISVLKQEHISLDVFDLYGNLVSKVIDRKMEKGVHQIRLENDTYLSGTYIGVLSTTSEKSFSQKFIIL